MRYFCCLLIALTVAAEVVVFDDFADGDLGSTPAWRADPTVNWFNPWHVERLGDRHWATCHRFGSMATPFLDPQHPGWRITLDLADGPIETAFDLRFELLSPQNGIGIFVLGREQRISMRLNSEGRLNLHFINNAGDDRPNVHDGGSVPPFVPGEPRRVAVRYSREAGVQLFLDGKEVYRLPEEKRVAALPLLTTMDSVAFAGTRDAGATNVPLLRSTGPDPNARVRIATIQVTGPRPTGTVDGLPAPTGDGTLLLAGIGLAGALDAAAIDPAWTARYARYPHLGEPLSAALTPAALAACRWVILGDVDGRQLGWQTAQILREYVRAGGNVLLLGGTIGVTSWLDGPFAADLPVRRAATMPIPVTAPDVAYRQPVDTTARLVEAPLGAGCFRIFTPATLGAPSRPFWSDPNWLGNLLKDQP